MASTLKSSPIPAPPVEPVAPQPPRRHRRRLVAIWALVLATVAGLAALTIAVVNDDSDGVTPRPVFTEHARLHVGDSDRDTQCMPLGNGQKAC